jgi:hypothetical protein
LILGPAVYDRHILALDIAALFEALAECAQTVGHRIGRPAVKKSDHRHCRLLRARRERPRGCCAAKQRDELASPHSITSSARASTVGGISRPSAFAVREYAERAAYLARFQTASTTTPCPIDATGLVYRSSSPASVNDRF